MQNHVIINYPQQHGPAEMDKDIPEEIVQYVGHTAPPPIVLNDLFPPYDISVKKSHTQGKIPYHHNFAKRKRK